MDADQRLISIGYEGRNAAELIQRLKDQDVQVLVDVRLTPLSRKKGLSKTALSAALAEAGIRYVHHRQLGNPKDNRDDFRKGLATSRERYRDVLTGTDGSEALRHVLELLGQESVALLCFERDHDQCHRHMVAEALGSQREISLIQA
ncbi:DUF488 domain-containing protein [Ornithinimicrobium sp. Arc0846-15]|nr:DUF488 domain-containing protein [Ornithinimicrobium laminariae]